MVDRRLWTQEQDNLIVQTVQRSKNLKWANILKQIIIVNPDFKRTSKQIRERWKFHLDPRLSNEAWTEEQQEIIFRSHVLKGSKWKQIEKLLPGRSEKSIKNFFYMTFRKSIRRVSKILGVKNSTLQSRQIKPRVLTKIIQTSNETPQKRQIIYRMFSLHRVKSGACKKINISKDDIKIYRDIMDDLTYFNELYMINKKQGIKALEQKYISSKIQNGILIKYNQKQNTIRATTAEQVQLSSSLSDVDEELEIQDEKQNEQQFEFPDSGIRELEDFQI